MPLYDLFGGKAREAARVYRHADGRTLEEVGDRAQAFIEQGVQVIRLQFGGYGGRGNLDSMKTENACEGAYYDPYGYQNAVVTLFDAMRSRFGFNIEFCHDVHERLEPIEAIRLAKELEPHRLFFLEDALAPEQVDWFDHMRRQTHTPLAMGELFTHPMEWRGLIANRQIDFIRCHISAIGGLTPARKLALFCEPFSVRTAWHGPRDVSPVGHAANMHLNLSSWNFGIQEWSGIKEAAQEVFPGSPQLESGYVYLNDKPGLGIDINETLAAKYPCDTKLPTWTNARRPDGTIARP
jgi:mannonate dehydratase